jgi:CheY-like chemotaxis protein
MPDSEAGRARASMLAHMRHELRTPLNAVIGYSEMLLEDAEDLGQPELVRDLTAVRAAGAALVEVVNEILDSDGPAVAEPSARLAAALQNRMANPLREVTLLSSDLVERVEASGPKDFLPELRSIRGAAAQLDAVLSDLEALTLAGQQALQDEEARQEAPGPGEGATGHAEADAVSGRVLVVDDIQTNRDLLASRLSREGHRVELAENGLQALEMIRCDPPDVVLLDMMMPGLNGFQVLQQMKQDPELRDIPVIMLSALDEMENVVRCIEAGAEDYLPKPFNTVLLRARLNACLEKKRLRDREVLHVRQIEEERRRADELLHVILPAEIVAELKATNSVRPRLYENVAVMFCDVVGFTPYCESQPPDEVISQLQRLVEAYEVLASEHGLLKIKTVGDSFMATGGLLTRLENPVLNSVQCGLRMLDAGERLPGGWKVRIGIHIGPAIAGLVGRQKYLFDLWGDTVNTAARVESHGREGAVNVSKTAWQQVQDHCHGDSLGLIQVKGKGRMELYRVHGLR